MEKGRMTNMWITNLNLIEFILFVIVGYSISCVGVSVIILFVADVIGVVKRKIKGEI